MNMQLALRRSARAPWFWRFLPWLTVAVLAAWVVHLAWPSAAIDDDTSTATFAAPPVHCEGAGHDWLLVVDPATHELVVYDANDGRPLHRLRDAGGTGSVDSIVGEGNWLIVAGDQHPGLQVLSLPDLQPAVLAAR